MLFEAGAAAGVVTADGTAHRAQEVILSAGTYGSAAILLRSGIGPAADLSSLEIEVLVDSPVGQYMQDHPFFYNVYALTPGHTQMVPGPLAQLWAATSDATAGELNLHINAQHLLDPEASPTGGTIVLAASLVQPESRGTLRLSSRRPENPPLIDDNFLDTDRDRRRMLEIVRLARRIARNSVLAPYIATEIAPGETVGDDELLDAIESAVQGYGHPTASAPMGRKDGEHAVVDAFGAVYGVTGLRVVDASILPFAPSAATNLTTIMIAERISSELRAARPAVTVKSSSPHEAFIRDLFAAVDTRVAENVADFVTDDVAFRFGSADPIAGKDNLIAASRAFSASIAGIHHEVVELWEPVPDTMVVELRVTYRRLDGAGLVLPCCNIFRLRDGLIDDYRIYMDVNPVFG